MASADERYWDVLPLPLVCMFNSRVGQHETIKWGGEPEAKELESHPSSEASAKEEGEEEEVDQEFSADEASQEAPGTGSGQLDQILESISALASSIALL